MERTNVENLRVYQLAKNVSDSVWDIVIQWTIFARDVVGKQLARAADGISANISEGSGRGTVAENRHFVRIARGSLYETRNWLRRAFRRKLLTCEQVESLKRDLNEPTRTLNGYLRSLNNKL